MFSEKAILDLKKLLGVLLDNKYKIIIFTLTTVLFTNIYVQNFQNKIKIEKIYKINKYVNSALGAKFIKREMIRFMKQNKDFNGGKVVYYNFKGKYILKATFVGINENKLNKNIEGFTKLFNKQVRNNFINIIKENKNEIIYEAKPVYAQLNKYNNDVKNLDQLMLNEVENNNLSKAYELEVLKKSLLKKIIEIKKDSKKVLHKSLKYKRLININEDNLFSVKQSKYVYEVNKLKFFIFSVLFSFIMSITLVLLFFKNKKAV